VSIQLIALLTNIGLALLKFIVGTIAGSRALIADAFNSAGDVIATFVAWLAFRYGLKPPDDDHHYGHQNAEAMAGLLLGGMLIATGAFICIDGVIGIADQKDLQAPGALAIYAAIATGITKQILYVVSIREGRRGNSPTLLASARDHRADVVSSLVALLGILVARAGYPAFDAIAGIVIGLYILYLSFEPLRDNTGILMQAAPPELAIRAEQIAAGVEGIRAVDQVRVQPIGGSYRMDMSVHVDGQMTVAAAHHVAHRAEDAIRAVLDNVTEVHIHIEPSPERP
jgi:cation diffusion facilitator family transporter